MARRHPIVEILMVVLVATVSIGGFVYSRLKSSHPPEPASASEPQTVTSATPAAGARPSALKPGTSAARGRSAKARARVTISVPPMVYGFGGLGTPYVAGRGNTNGYTFADPPSAEREVRAARDVPEVRDEPEAREVRDVRETREPAAPPRGGSKGVRFKASLDAAVNGPEDVRGLVILQIGDSHTAIDQFTGELRHRLQAIYGDGGPGYFAAGKPNIGVRSPFRVGTTAGWSYKSLQGSEDGSGFLLSGFNALATTPDESMTFTADEPIAYDVIEIEAIREPGGGAIDIALDGALASQFELAAEKPEPIVIRLVPERGRVDRMRQIAITTRGEGSVKISSIAVLNRSFGVSYNAVGYPGATVDILNKLDSKMFADELRRLSPQIVVLEFGTNEGFNDGLDLERYEQAYKKVVHKIVDVLPKVSIVVVSPANANRLPAQCKAEAQKASCRRAGVEVALEKNGNGECAWKTPPQLNRVREVQREIARLHRLSYWNWGSMMPDDCGAHEWVAMMPPLMARDHVHFTLDGYRKSATEFLQTLLPIIEKLRAPKDVVSND